MVLPLEVLPLVHIDRAPCGCARLLSVAQVRAVKATERSPQRKGAAAGRGRERFSPEPRN
jgi:hypothetical protein